MQLAVADLSAQEGLHEMKTKRPWPSRSRGENRLRNRDLADDVDLRLTRVGARRVV